MSMVPTKIYLPSRIHRQASKGQKRLVVQSHFFRHGVVMDEDIVILLAQCLSNRVRHVYTFAIDYLGQGRGQGPWSAKSAYFLNFDARYALKLKMRPDTR